MVFKICTELSTKIYNIKINRISKQLSLENVWDQLRRYRASVIFTSRFSLFISFILPLITVLYFFNTRHQQMKRTKAFKYKAKYRISSPFLLFSLFH